MKTIETRTEFEKFDGVMKQILSVSHKQLQEREKKYKQAREKKKRAKT